MSETYLRAAASFLHRRLRVDGNFGPWSEHSEEDKQAWEADVAALLRWLEERDVIKVTMRGLSLREDTREGTGKQDG